MNHFLRKHRYWLLALVVASVVAIAYFQLRDDGGLPAGPANPAQPTERLPIGP